MAVSEISRVAVAADRFASQWGVQVYCYSYMNEHLDLQNLLVAVTQNRAAKIELEVQPLQDIITRRNTRLDHYGAVLQTLTELQAKFTGDATSGETVPIGGVLKNPGFTVDDYWAILDELGYGDDPKKGTTEIGFTKYQVEGAVTRCKNEIDKMNNDSQRDMTRLQALVDRRDESFSAATSLMTSVSETRDSTLKSM